MWYLCLRRALQPRSEWTVSLDEHLVWLKRQHETGKILFSGPKPDRTMSLYIIFTGSLEDAERIASEDPFTAAGFCSAEIIEWEIHQALGVGPFTAAEQRLLAGDRVDDPLLRASGSSPVAGPTPSKSGPFSPRPVPCVPPGARA